MKMLQEISCQTGILYPVKISFNGEDGLSFSAKQKLSSLISLRPKHKETQRESDCGGEVGDKQGKERQQEAIIW